MWRIAGPGSSAGAAPATPARLAARRTATSAARGGVIGLLGQDQLVRLRDAEPVLLPAVHDDDLARALEQRGAVEAPRPARDRRGRGCGGAVARRRALTGPGHLAVRS